MFKLLFVVLAALLAVAFATPVPAPQSAIVSPVAYYGGGAVYPSVYSGYSAYSGVPAYSAYSSVPAGVVPAAYGTVTYG